MRHWELIATLALSTVGWTQYLPSELSSALSVRNPLAAQFDNISLTRPAQLIATNETGKSSNVAVPQNVSSTASSAPSYLFIMVDPSYNTSDPTYVVLHTMFGNLTNASTASTFAPSFVRLGSAPEPPLAPYIGPQPPSGKPSHNYTLLLFAQPDDFAVPAQYDPWLPLNLSDVYSRTGFPLLEFIRDTDLGNPVAANYFRLDLADANSTGASSSASTSSPTQTMTSSSVPTSRASKLDVPDLFLGSIFGMVSMAVLCIA